MRRRDKASLSVVPVFASAPTPTLHEVQTGPAAGALARLLVARVRPKATPEQPLVVAHAQAS